MPGANSQFNNRTNYKLTLGKGRSKLHLDASIMGNDLLVRIFNTGVHIGAVALGEYDAVNQRASVSVITRLGHKDDALARKAAHDISRTTQRPVCVIAGVHIDDITDNEINLIADTADQLACELIARLKADKKNNGI